MSEKTKSNTGLSVINPINLDPIRDFKQIQEFALAVANSTMADQFKVKGKESVEVADIIGAISIGIEIGIPPMSAISLGKTLNAKSYLSVLKGKAMGLDPITSISKVHIIPTGNGDIMYTSVDIINKAYLDTNTRLKFIRDYEATPKYYTLNDDNTVSYVGHKWKIYNEDLTVKTGFFVYDSSVHSIDDIKSAKQKGQLVVYKGNGITFVTSIHIQRPEKGIDEIFHYSTQEAIDAGLLSGYHSSKVVQDGNKYTPFYVKGKLNWNDNTPQMLRNRCLSIPGRIILADRLTGVYSVDEIRDMEVQINEEPIQEAKIVE